jgi:hypothetical protein
MSTLRGLPEPHATDGAVFPIDGGAGRNTLADFSLVTLKCCAREDAISCKDSQLITPSVSAVAARNGLTDLAITLKNGPRRDDVVCSRPEPTTPRS